MNPTTAVLMPCYNNAAYVADAIGSVLRQTRPPTEIIVVDDGSTDESARVIAGFGDPVRLVRQKNAGRAAAMNNAIAHTHSELFAVIDADDLWLPELLERNVDALVASDAPMAYCQGILCDEYGSDLGRRFGKPMPHDTLAAMLQDNHVFGGGPVLRTDLVRDLGGYNPSFWPCDDYHLWLRVAAAGTIAYQPVPLAKYRSHAGQVSRARVLMARQKLDAKLHFLRTHPKVVKKIGRPFIRKATEEQFAELCQLVCKTGQLELARALTTHYLKRFPHRVKALALWLRTRLPYRMQQRWFEPRTDIDQTGLAAAVDS